jgi:exosortase/archaeosortase family protein
VVRFVLLFGGLLVAFQLVYYELIVTSSFFESYLAVSSKVAAFLLGLVGEPVRASGGVLTSTFSMSVKQGCDGLQAMAIVASGVLALPGGRRVKLLGVALGVLLLLGLNVLRIASLFWAGIHWPERFQLLHVHVWPAVLVFAAFVYWIGWASRTMPRSRPA